MTAGYVSGKRAGASMLIWQLAFIPWAAVAFHVAARSLLVCVWRDARSPANEDAALR